MITLLLVDDQPAARLGLCMRLALERDMTVVGETDNSAAIPALVAALHPDAVVMDIDVPGADGVAPMATLRQTALRSPVVVLSLRDDPLTRRRALAGGATAFVSKWDAPEMLLTMIRRVALERAERSA